MALLTTTLFRLSIFKNWLGAGGAGWVNTYEFLSAEEIAINSDVWTSLVSAFINFEKTLHLTSVFIDRAVLSTWAPDSTPYNAQAVKVFPYSVSGLRVAGGGDRVDLNAVLNVRRSPDYGRSGKLAFRGVLTEFDVSASASGFWTLDPGSDISDGATVWTSATDFITEYLGGGGATVKLAMIGQVGEVFSARTVFSLIPYGAGFSRMNHRHFDRPEA